MSVIIPTLEAGGALRRLIEALRGQTLAPREIIVIDSASTDGTPDIARECGARVIGIERRDFDHGGTRNLAASHAVGEVLVFMTQDALPAHPEMLERLVGALLSDARVACAYARQVPRDDADVLERLTRAYLYPEQPAVKWKSDLERLGIRTFFCSNVCAAYRRDVFEQLGRFPAPALFNEDLFFAAKCIFADYGVAYAADARVVHSHHYTLGQQFRRYFDNGVSMRGHDAVYAWSGVGRSGGGMVLAVARELVRTRRVRYMPRLIAESAAKFIGYQLGRRYRLLPAALCRRFSMHRGIWDRYYQSRKRADAGAAEGETLQG
ncbi:MAG: glycosyl transferase family 2 [Bacillus thermozeamaize]|uniref:Glycosyl transferase family 2 n=1 Tax=Bacillus thermozeamaize TaxID=230954 RepID=A0A1Y3PNP8_9BACI|nr:MAG: glycosyl transferase family 2 [Bacillus thermozeamaize]